MSSPLTAPTPRRGFLARLGVLSLAASGLVPLPLAGAVRRAAGPDPDPSDKWLQDLTGKHRQIFDMPKPTQGVGLLHIRNYIDTYRTAYHAPAKEVNAIGTLYGMSLPMGFTDAMWAKYPFGQATDSKDAGGQPLTRNMFFRPQQGDPFAFGFLDSSIEALQKQNVRFIMCNNALSFWVQQLASKGLGTPEAIRAELVANTLPGIVLVPAMVVAINRAQEHGFSYMYV